MKSRINILLCTVLILLLIIATLVLYIVKNPSRVWVVEDVKASPGDSVWSICKEYCPDGVDIRDYVYEVVTLNDMSNPQLIDSGDTIKVYVELSH